MALHAEDALRSSRVFQVLNLLLAVATLETIGTESLIISKNGKILDLVFANIARPSAVIADQRAVL